MPSRPRPNVQRLARAWRFLLALVAAVLTACGEEDVPPVVTIENPVNPVDEFDRGPLAAKLRATSEQTLRLMPQETTQLLRRAQGELSESGLLGRALNVGDPAKGFRLVDSEGTAVSLKELRDQGPVVVTFYRGKW